MFDLGLRCIKAFKLKRDPLGEKEGEGRGDAVLDTDVIGIDIFCSTALGDGEVHSKSALEQLPLIFTVSQGAQVYVKCSFDNFAYRDEVTAEQALEKYRRSRQ